ncbi:hypothetical protein ACWD6N_03400 [Micromonospora sp. NPDC005163]
MATPEDVAAVVEAVGPLCEPLHRCVEKAADIALNHFTEYDMTDSCYRRERTDLTRAHSRRLLRAADLGGWQVAQTKNNGQLLLRRNLMCAKVLHVAPDNLVPAPGSNRARVAYYRNPPADLFGVETSRLLVMWSVDPKTGEAGFRMVRPTGSWSYGEQHLADVDFDLPRASTDLSSLEFVPDDNAITLPIDFGDEGTNDDLAHGW